MTRRYNSLLCGVLVFILLFSNISVNTYGDIANEVINSDDYKEWIKNIVIPAGYDEINKFGLHANMEIYYGNQDEDKVDKIVYGDYSDVANNEQDTNLQWRYLGFNKDGFKVPNGDFIPDREMGEDEKYTEWTFEEVSGAKTSWNNARRDFDSKIIEHNKKAEWLKEGEKTGLSVNYHKINDEKKVLLLSPATPLTEGSVRIEHYVNRKLYYSTFTIPAMLALKGEITGVDKGTIGAAEDSVDISLGSNANFITNGYIENNSYLIDEMKVYVTHYKIDSGAKDDEGKLIGDGFIELQKQDKEKYGKADSEVIQVGKEGGVITFRREDFKDVTPNNVHIVEFKGEASFKSELTDHEEKIELTKAVKITIEELDLTAKKINVKHFEKDSEGGSTSLLGESNVSLKEDEPTTVEALGGKKLLETKVGPDISLMISSEDRSVQVTADMFILGDLYFVEFYYEKSDISVNKPVGGDISFNPDEAQWTRKGRIRSGKGVYPVNVTYNGDNPAIGQGKAIFHYIEEQEEEGEQGESGGDAQGDGGDTSGDVGEATPLPAIEYDIEVPIDVEYPLDEIKVNGSAIDKEVIIKGDSGTVDIVKEGYRMQLNAKGKFGEKQYDEPEPPEPDPASVVEEIPEAPDDPEGN